MARLDSFAQLLPGGGSSTRFGGGNKLLAPLNGIPVFVHTIRSLAPLFPEGAVFMAVLPAFQPAFEAAVKQFIPEIRVDFISGGATRTESVRNQVLAAAGSGGFEFVSIHDAARPLIRGEVVCSAAEICRKTGAALVCHKVTDTLKSSADGTLIDGTVPRESIWSAETPQMFRLADFRLAMDQALADGGTFTDDSQIVERFTSLRVSIVPDPYPNPKITIAEDMALCRALLAEDHIKPSL